MKALLCTRAGTPDDLTIADLPDPVAGPDRRWCGSKPRR